MQSYMDIRRQRASQNPSVIENPNTALIDNQIRMVRADQKSSSNPWTQIMDMVGAMAMSTGSSMMSQGMSQAGGIGGLFGGGANASFNGMTEMPVASVTRAAMGGKVDNAINVEGKEVIETPDGTVAELKGPSHSQGGIDMLVPPGTEIFSQRLKGPDGKTMADRKKAREKKLAKAEKLFDKNQSDATLKATLRRIQDSNQREEDADIQQMNIARAMMEGMQQVFAMGGTPGYQEQLDNVGPDPNNPYGHMSDVEFLSLAQNFLQMNPQQTSSKTSGTNPEGGFDWGSIFGGGESGGFTLGDGIGMVGNIVSTFGPMENTRANRAGDTPNINAFKDYGKDGLKALDKSKGYVAGQRDENLRDLELARAGAINRNRNSARGINTMRALDLTVDNAINERQQSIYGAYAQQMMNILAQQAGMENQQDQVVMQGEQNRDLADRMDRDNYFSQMAQDIATKGTGLQKIGRDINQMKTRQVTGQIMSELYSNFEIDFMTGKTKFKAEEVIEKNPTFYSKLVGHPNAKEIHQGNMEGKYIIKGDKLYNKEGVELDINTLKPIE